MDLSSVQSSESVDSDIDVESFDSKWHIFLLFTLSITWCGKFSAENSFSHAAEITLNIEDMADMPGRQLYRAVDLAAALSP